VSSVHSAKTIYNNNLGKCIHSASNVWYFCNLHHSVLNVSSDVTFCNWFMVLWQRRMVNHSYKDNCKKYITLFMSEVILWSTTDLFYVSFMNIYIWSFYLKDFIIDYKVSVHCIKSGILYISIYLLVSCEWWQWFCHHFWRHDIGNVRIMMFLKVCHKIPDSWVSKVAGQPTFNTQLNMIFLFHYHHPDWHWCPPSGYWDLLLWGWSCYYVMLTSRTDTEV
jgi:hypothetical protein